LQTRTGSTKHIRGSPILVSQQDPQYICPQRRQWCCKNTDRHKIYSPFLKLDITEPTPLVSLAHIQVAQNDI